MLEYRVGRPGWKLSARLGVALKANVSVVYDHESNTLVAACSDFAPYLEIVTEGRTFEELTGIKVNYQMYDSNETMYSKVAAGGAEYDVVIPSDYMIARMIEEDMLEPLNFDNIPNASDIDPELLNPAYDPENLYSVPYMWGLLGVIYNKTMVDEADLGSWDLMWNEKYADDILMFDNSRDAIGIGLTFGLIVAVAVQFIAPSVVRPFTSDEAVVLAGASYIRGYIFDCLFAGVQFSFSGYFCAYGKSGLSFLHNTLSILLVRVPGAYLASKFFPQTLLPMGLASACGSLFSILVCVIAYHWLKRQQRAVPHG